LTLLESLPRPAEQNVARLAIEQANLAMEKAAKAVERMRPLRERNEVSEATMHETESAWKQAELQWKTAQAQFDVLMLKPRPQAIDEARSRVTVAETAVATARTQLDLHTIRSMIGGKLDSLSCQLGQTLAIGAPVGQVVDSRQFHAVIWVAAPVAQRVQCGQAAKVISGSAPSDADGAQSADRTIAGKVVSLGNVVDPQTGNLPVRIFADNPQGRFTLGQVVRAVISVESKSVLAVPAAAIQDMGEGPLLRAVRDHKIVVLHPTLGRKDDRWIEVSGTDLKVGEPVVVDDGYNLPEDTKVSVEGKAEEGAGILHPAFFSVSALRLPPSALLFHIP
jgi:RND family efflux transporter MFP subunit